MDEEQIDRREFAATQKVSGRASRELLESLAFHRKPRRGPMSERIVNGVCTTCKGDAYLFYDAAGGHCWKCDVAAAEARAVRAEGDVTNYAALVEVVQGVNTSLRLLPLTGIDDAQRIYDSMYKILDRLARWLIDTPAYPGKPAPREIPLRP